MVYIVIEGPDGTGKTTQARLLAKRLLLEGRPAKYVHEPGQTPMGLELEKIIKNRSLARQAQTDLLLFTANRIEAFSQVIQPSLRNGEVVVADRNWLSSAAYQGIAGGIGIAEVQKETAKWLPKEYAHPTFTILLYLPESQHQVMLTGRGTSEKDYFESKPEAFLQKIKEGYQKAGELCLPNRYAHVEASGAIEEVHGRILAVLRQKAVI